MFVRSVAIVTDSVRIPLEDPVVNAYHDSCHLTWDNSRGLCMYLNLLGRSRSNQLFHSLLPCKVLNITLFSIILSIRETFT
jgi:hypothetical protein